MPSPMGPVPPAPLPPPPVWNARDAEALCAQLDQTAAACIQAHADLRRAAARASVEWRGPARSEFDLRHARLLGGLRDTADLAALVAAQVRAQDARVSRIRRSMGVVECATSLSLMCGFPEVHH